MSWCDRLASVPTAGFRISPHYAAIDILLNSISPILDRVPEDQARHMTVDQPTAAFAVALTTNDGFRYSLSHNAVSVGFNHRVRHRSVSGGPPIMEMLSRPMPYTSLLPNVSDKLIEATLLMPEAKNRTISRIGIVATTPVSEADIPPGIQRLISYLGRPWKSKFDYFNINLTMVISENAEIKERCVHHIIRPEESDQLTTLTFDWQRIFKTPRVITKANCETIMNDGQKGALKYFEELAEGSRFDEELIRETVGI